MSVSRDARDTASALYYQKALEALRERHLARSLDGETLPSDFWDRGEAEALEATKREFFNLKARQIFLPDRADSMTDDEDFRARATELMELGALETHRVLREIPWVGHPDHEDPEPPPEREPSTGPVEGSSPEGAEAG